MSLETSRLSKALLIVFGIVMMAGLFAFVPEVVLAQTSELSDVGDASGLTTTDLPTMIGRLISAFLGVLGIVLLVIIIYAGFLWMTAGGNAEQVDKAKKWMINAVVGLIIVLASYAITAFIINALGGTLTGGDGSSSSDDSSSSIERRSGSLGQGGINYHYPGRNDTDIARNTKIFITFKSAMDIEGFIDGYDTNGTPEDTSDDTTATGLNTDNILIYKSEEGEEAALTSEEVSVTFTEDLKTFSFSPEEYLGSSTENTSYTVFIDNVTDTDGDEMINSGGYEWSFEVSTEVDLDPPYVLSVSPKASGEYDRNIVVQITFSEAVDPTSATGTRESDSGFSNIQTHIGDSVPLTGVYSISNSYKTVTFTTDEACGTNSCGETIYCLPGNESITVDVIAATVDEENPPQSTGVPYDGIVDTAANAMDGDGDGDAGDDYSWSFTTTDDINLDAPEVDTISPDILEEDVELDQEVSILFDSIMMSNSLDSDTITMTPHPTHEMWYIVDNSPVNTSRERVSSSGEDVIGTEVFISHGVFLETTEDELTGESCASEVDCESGEECNSDGQCVEPGQTYLYNPEVTSGVRNQYQNCFVPGEGPDAGGGSCGTSESQPYCCNGTAKASDCGFFSS